MKVFVFLFYIKITICIFAERNTVVVAQLVRVSVCGSGGRGFESHQPPTVKKPSIELKAFFIFYILGKSPIKSIA